MLIDTPIGALLFVSGAIACFVLIILLAFRKGSGKHMTAGYIFVFAIAFFNYAVTSAYYQSLVPLASIMFSTPISIISTVIGLAAIIPNQKSKFRLIVHIISMMVSASAFVFGVIVNWYHFKVSLLNVFAWSDFSSILVLSLPIFVIGSILVLHYLTSLESYLVHFSQAESLEDSMVELEDSKVEHSVEDDIEISSKMEIRNEMEMRNDIEISSKVEIRNEMEIRNDIAIRKEAEITNEIVEIEDKATIRKTTDVIYQGKSVSHTTGTSLDAVPKLPTRG